MLLFFGYSTFMFTFQFHQIKLKYHPFNQHFVINNYYNHYHIIIIIITQKQLLLSMVVKTA